MPNKLLELRGPDGDKYCLAIHAALHKQAMPDDLPTQADQWLAQRIMFRACCRVLSRRSFPRGTPIMAIFGSTTALILCINAVAGAFLYGRLASMGYLPPPAVLQARVQDYMGRGAAAVVSLPPAPYALCGLLDERSYYVGSNRVVLPDGVKPAAGA
jgi:hypothetical protein